MWRWVQACRKPPELTMFCRPRSLSLSLSLSPVKSTQFQVMRPKEEKETEDLYISTKKLLDNLAKLRTSQYVKSKAKGSDDQAELYSIVREGREWAGTGHKIGMG